MLLGFSTWRMATSRTSKIHLRDQLEAAQNAVASALAAAISAMKKQNDELSDTLAMKKVSDAELKEMLTSIAFYKKRFDEV